MANQLLVSTETTYSSDKKSKEFLWGVPLMKEIKATSLSILSEPNLEKNPKKAVRRAVVFVAATNEEMSELTYTSFQLQLTRSTHQNISGSHKNQRQFSILAKKSIQGNLKDGARSIGPISSVYLAGASFRFDLENKGKLPGHALRDF